jgi:hypothetical protein
MRITTNLVYEKFFIGLVFALTFTSLSSPFDQVFSQIDPFQEQIEPIPPSNNTNQTAPIVLFIASSPEILFSVFFHPL